MAIFVFGLITGALLSYLGFKTTIRQVERELDKEYDEYAHKLQSQMVKTLKETRDFNLAIKKTYEASFKRDSTN